MEFKWEKLTSPEFEEAIEKSKGLCILPLGCLEKHGEHQTVGCDAFIGDILTKAAAELEYAVVFPTGYWVGDLFGVRSAAKPETVRGGIAIKPETLLTVLTELCEEIARNGFRKILIVNVHGGNVGFLDFFVRAMCYEKRNFATMWVRATTRCSDPKVLYPDILSRPEAYPMMTDEDMAVLKKFAETGTGGGHADLCEVAMCMSEMPETVRPDMFESCSGISTGKADYLTKMGVNHGKVFGVNFPNAFHGYASTGCTANIGKAMVKAEAERLAKIFKTLKEDEFCVDMVKGTYLDEDK
ncbi:MAG: creatininase family protein [Clostridia bacterium]|nr:creatininase family protein [Clostridia bacterium]